MESCSKPHKVSERLVRLRGAFLLVVVVALSIYAARPTIADDATNAAAQVRLGERLFKEERFASPKGDLITSWLNPTSIFIGALAVAFCAYLAAVYLSADAARRGDADLVAAFRARALGAGAVAGVLSNRIVSPSTISAEPSSRSRTPRLSSAPKVIGLPCSRRIRFSFSSRTASNAPSL